MTEIEKLHKKKETTVILVNVRWLDAYLETFIAREVRFGSDLLWLELVDKKTRHIPLRHVRWFSLDPKSVGVPREKP